MGNNGQCWKMAIMAVMAHLDMVINMVSLVYFRNIAKKQINTKTVSKKCKGKKLWSKQI